MGTTRWWQALTTCKSLNSKHNKRSPNAHQTKCRRKQIEFFEINSSFTPEEGAYLNSYLSE